MKIDLSDVRQLWGLYERGVEHNSGIDLYETVKLNNQFYIGDQWRGINIPDLDKPALNMLQMPIAHMVSNVASDSISISMTSTFSTPEDERYLKSVVAEVERIREQENMETLSLESVNNAAVDGDACMYHYWDESIRTGQPVQGDVRCMLIDNTNCIFGNPAERNPQKQPYIIIVRRAYIEDAINEAVDDGMSEEDARQQIKPDDDGYNYSEDQGDNSLVTLLTVLTRDHKTGTIKAVITAPTVIIKEEWDTELTLYPVSWFPWQKQKRSYHGVSAVTYNLHNQILLNKLLAEKNRCIQSVAYPKVVYDGSRIASWDNRIGQNIKADANVNDVFAQIIPGANAASDVGDMIETLWVKTKEAMGASDAAMGQSSMDNTSAIIALQEANAVPLKLKQRGYYSFEEQNVRITLDILRAKAGVRYIPIDDETYPAEQPMAGQLEGLPAQLTSPAVDSARTIGTVADYAGAPAGTMPLDFSKLGEMAWTLKVDVGEGSQYSEIIRSKTLDNLREAGIIDTIEYVERLPDKYLQGKEKLLERLRQQPLVPDGSEGGEDVISPYSNKINAAKQHVQGLRQSL